VYRSTKTYCHNVGLSCCFRQWRAQSHCNKLHGYAIQVGFVFEAEELDANIWVVDFGSLKEVKQWLEQTFDHKTLVAFDDPEYTLFMDLHSKGIIDMVSVNNTGCEAFAKLVYDMVVQWLQLTKQSPRVKLVSVEVREHGANSAIYGDRAEYA
jgi:6-pyruvoyltetrahydropterin/6-carboxytetrahydropterin synthase